MSLANDVASIHARYLTANAMLCNKLRAAGYVNVISVDALSFASGNRAEVATFVGEEAPGANYNSYATVGDRYIQVTFTSGVPSAIAEYVLVASGVWGQAVIVPQSTALVRTTDTKEINVQSANSGTGDHRAVYAKISLTHATAGSGDALRGYAVANGGVNALRGAHLTAEVGAGGSVTGLAAGATCQFSTVTGLTLSGGTAYALNLVSDLKSAVTGMTSTAFIGVSDLQTAKLQALFDITASATGVVGATTGSTAAGTLKVKVDGTTKYIQLYASAS